MMNFKFIVFIFITSILLGCEENDPHYVKSLEVYTPNTYNAKVCLPRNSENIKDLGFGWYEFTWDGKRFLYHKEYTRDQSFESLTQLIEN